MTGDDCAHDPIALPAGADVTGSTVDAHDDFTAAASCFSYATGDGPDLVYAFTTPADGGGNYTFTLTPEASFDVAMYLTAGCASGAQSACLGGADLYGEGGAESFTALLAAGTTYSLVVDGHAGESGAFTLRADYAGQPPTSDVCGAVVLDAGSGAATAFGATEGAVNDYESPTCGGSGPDVFYGFSLAAEARVRATINPLADGGDDYLSPVAVILGGCPFPDGGAAELGCGGPPTQFFEPAIADVPDLPPGDYVVVVDSAYDFFVGPYALDLEVLPAVTAAPANDGCAAPAVIALSTLTDGGSFGSADVDTLAAADDVAPDPAGACSGNDAYATGADVVYAVDAPPGATHLTASFVSTRADLDPSTGEAVTAVLLRDGACGAGSELACASGGASANVTGGARYFIWVDQKDHQPTPQGTLEVSFP